MSSRSPEVLAPTPPSQTSPAPSPHPHPSQTSTSRIALSQLQQRDSGAWAEGVPIPVSFWDLSELWVENGAIRPNIQTQAQPTASASAQHQYPPLPQSPNPFTQTLGMAHFASEIAFLLAVGSR